MRRRRISPRLVIALVVMGMLIRGTKFSSRVNQVVVAIKLAVLVLFIGLFVVNHAFQQTGLADEALAVLGTGRQPLDRGGARQGEAEARRDRVGGAARARAGPRAAPPSS